LKTKDLIRLLREEDPSGELECSVWGYDIFSVESAPAYWDGSLEVFERNEKGRIVGGKITDQGSKIVIKHLSLDEILLDNPDLPVEFVGLLEGRRERAKKYIEESRKKNKRIIRNVHQWSFVRYVEKYLKDLCWDGCPDADEVKRIAIEFSDKHNPWDIPLPEDIRKMRREEVRNGKVCYVYPSEEERDWTHYDRIIKITSIEEELTIELVE
jgi:hypothetical protein